MSQSLIRIMQAETEAVVAFCAALRTERLAIRSGDFQELNRQIERKGAIIEMIAKLGAARAERMAVMGIVIDVNLELSGDNVDEAVRSAWKGLTFQARDARESTALTETVLNAHTDFTAEALAILRRRGAETAVYGPDGLTRARTSGLPLGNG
jgi:flagellar biosynthesis/type III secretory pathway chaperone